MNPANVRCVVIATALAWFASARGGIGETNVPDALTLRVQADRLASSGEWKSAIAAYEALVDGDPSLTPVLAPVLVRLAVEGKQTEPALRWAAEVAREHPRPDAYWAGVYTELGHYEAALQKLVAAERAAQTPRERVELHWQRADIHRRRGDFDASRAELTRAVRAAEGQPEHDAALRRLEQIEPPPRATPPPP